jgi:hypothetical protein
VTEKEALPVPYPNTRPRLRRLVGPPLRGSVAAALLVLALAGPTSAQPTGAAEVSGTVLALDGGELVLDVGAAQGLATGTTVELWRPLELKHPVTGKIVRDRFRIGTLELVQVRPLMSLARAVGEPLRPPQRGDVVLLAGASPLPAAAPSGGASSGAKPPAEAPAGAQAGDAKPAEGAGLDADAAAVAKMFEELSGADLVTRIRRYEDYVRTTPNGRFARVLYEEALSLRNLYALSREPKGEATGGATPSPTPDPDALSFTLPSEVLAESPLSLALELVGSQGAVLHVRTTGQPAYASFPMSARGDRYFGVVLPAEQLVAPELELFIEATDALGHPHAVLGSPADPLRLAVRKIERPRAPDPVEAEASVWADYADYNRMRGNDRVFQTEGSIGMRLGDTGVRAVRTGFGVYRGVGGGIAELDDLGLDGREIGLTYGYLEGEFAPSAKFSVISRLAVGLLEDGVSGGAQGLIRIGSDRGTNLVLGGEVLGGVGLRSIVELNLAAFERFPILFRAEVTDQPAGVADTSEAADSSVARGETDVGLRGIVQGGFRVTPDFALSLRGSFQGRNIKHAGPGFGGGVSYTW